MIGLGGCSLNLHQPSGQTQALARRHQLVWPDITPALQATAHYLAAQQRPRGRAGAG